MAFLKQVQRHANTVGKIVGIAHTAYQVGKGIYHVAQAAAPFVAAALL